jgi:hypothetical protein
MNRLGMFFRGLCFCKTVGISRPIDNLEKQSLGMAVLGLFLLWGPAAA